MRFLITNDDGFDAPGLAALHAALHPLGEVIVVAPAVCHSSRGHAVETKKPIQVERKLVKPFGRVHVVHSSPADCVRVALAHLLQKPPDLVVAGINPGANLGVDLYYSGTAAAAREAALMGCPAIAVSRYIRAETPIVWSTLAGHTRRVVSALLAPQFLLPAGHFWNVNFPARSGDCHEPQLTFAQPGTGPHSVGFQVVAAEGESQTLAYSGVYQDRGRSETCDVAAVFAGRITASLVGPSLTPADWPGAASSISLNSPACVD